MTRIAPVAALAALAFATAARAENVDHPAYLSWAGKPAGTRIVMRSRTEAKGRILTTTTTTTLRSVLADRVKLESSRVSDATGTVSESPLEQHDQYRLFPLMGNTKKEQVGKPTGAIATGEETLEVGDRSFKAVWYDTEGAGDGGLKLKTRTWICDDAPGRLLKSVTSIPTAGTTVTVEMIELDVPEAEKPEK